MSTIKNKGFTIIELMIAVAIIGILAAIAVPAYSNYTTRAKVSEALSFADSAKTAVSEFYQSNGSFPITNTQAGLPTSMSGTNTASVAVGTAGIIDVATSITGITNFTLTFSPSNNNGTINWVCNAPSASGQYVPSSCNKL